MPTLQSGLYRTPLHSWRICKPVASKLQMPMPCRAVSLDTQAGWAMAPNTSPAGSRGIASPCCFPAGRPRAQRRPGSGHQVWEHVLGQAASRAGTRTKGQSPTWQSPTSHGVSLGTLTLPACPPAVQRGAGAVSPWRNECEPAKLWATGGTYTLKFMLPTTLPNGLRPRLSYRITESRCRALGLLLRAGTLLSCPAMPAKPGPPRAKCPTP